MTTATQTTGAVVTGRVFRVYSRFDHSDGEQAVLGAIVDGAEEKSYRVGFSNYEPDFGPVVTWEKGGEVLYWVTCSPTGVPEQCTCPDFRFQKRRVCGQCKHMQASAALIRRGVFKMG